MFKRPSQQEVLKCQPPVNETFLTPISKCLAPWVVFCNSGDGFALVHLHTPAMSSYDPGKTYARQLAQPGLWPLNKANLADPHRVEPVTLFSLAQHPNHLSQTANKKKSRLNDKSIDVSVEGCQSRVHNNLPYWT